MERDLEATGLTLAALDRDGAIGEALARVHGQSRAEFLRRAALGGGALVAALAEPPTAEAAARADQGILNYDLTFEYLQSTFYTEAERIGTIASMPRREAFWARVLGSHERAHVAILKSVLGRAAVRKPSFNFGGVTDDAEAFVRTAVAMEDLTVALLTGQLPVLRDRKLVAAVFSLLTVEARHAAWARRIRGFQPVRAAFDEPKRVAEVRRLVAATGFVASRRQTRRRRRRPRFTG
jgi:hypothetical protein